MTTFHRVKTLEEQYSVQVFAFQSMMNIGQWRLKHTRMPQQPDQFVLLCQWSVCTTCEEWVDPLNRLSSLLFTQCVQSWWTLLAQQCVTYLTRHHLSSLKSLCLSHTPALHFAVYSTTIHTNVYMVAELGRWWYLWQPQMTSCRNWADLRSTVERSMNGMSGASWWETTCPSYPLIFQHYWQAQRTQRAQIWAWRKSKIPLRTTALHQPRNSSTSWWWT